MGVTINMRRVIATASSVAVLSATVIGPALAGGKNDDGEDRGTPMSLMSAILWFVVLPLTISAVISLFVLAPGWMRSAQDSLEGGYLNDPTLGDRREVESQGRTAIES